MGNSLIKAIAGGLLLGVLGAATIKSFQDSYDSGRPRVEYYHQGKKVITKFFKTNEELKAYENSEQGKRDREYYSSMDSRK